MLRGTGVAMSLPWLSAMEPAVAKTKPSIRPKRFVAMTLGLGLVAENLFPSNSGFDYQPSRYLEGLQNLRDQITVVSGSSHPGVTGGPPCRSEYPYCFANGILRRYEEYDFR